MADNDREDNPGAATAADNLQPDYDSLRKRGHSITAQRETILQIFREQPDGTHHSAEELYQKL